MMNFSLVANLPSKIPALKTAYRKTPLGTAHKKAYV